MAKSTASERAYVRWQAEKNPGALLAALQGMARTVRDMDPRLRELISEEIEKDRTADKTETAPKGAAELGTGPEGMVSAPDLGKELGLGEKAIRALGNRLQRWRHKHEGGWMEIESSEREPHGPRFLYNREAIQQVIAKYLPRKT